jgi:hypothetical protein
MIFPKTVPTFRNQFSKMAMQKLSVIVPAPTKRTDRRYLDAPPTCARSVSRSRGRWLQP